MISLDDNYPDAGVWSKWLGWHKISTVERKIGLVMLIRIELDRFT